jgi:hypothetical protein
MALFTRPEQQILTDILLSLLRSKLQSAADCCLVFIYIGIRMAVKGRAAVHFTLD